MAVVTASVIPEWGLKTLQPMCERALKLGMIVNNLLCTGRLAKLIVLGQGIKSIVRDVELDLFFAELSFFHYLNDNCM